jgi:hypothetical protein
MPISCLERLPFGQQPHVPGQQNKRLIIDVVDESHLQLRYLHRRAALDGFEDRVDRPQFGQNPFSAVFGQDPVPTLAATYLAVSGKTMGVLIGPDSEVPYFVQE